MNEKILWISHSALSSFAKCPHLYYLEYEYRNPKTGNRIQIINPYFSLGLAVHETIEGLLDFPIEKRKKISLKERFHNIFDNYKGFKGGFISKKKEKNFYERGIKMVERVESSSFLEKPSTSEGIGFPKIDLIGRNIKLVGSIDWVEILPSGGAHIIDFKTGNSKESNGSLQLPIYTILSKKNIKREVEKVSYWYLEHDNEPSEQEISDIDGHIEEIKKRALEIKKAIEEESYSCNYSGNCFACRDYEKIFRGDALMVSEDENRKKDVFCIFKKEEIIEKILEEDFLDEREKKMFEMRIENPIEIVNKKMRLTDEKSKKITKEIKRKMKENLHHKELKVIVRELSKNKI